MEGEENGNKKKGKQMMEITGYVRVRSHVPEVKVADPEYNCERILKAIDSAENDGVDILVMPELCITGYTCGDLFEQELLLEKSDKALRRICEETEGNGILIVVGAPVRTFGRLYNCGIAIQGGEILGAVPKIHIPNYSEFYEKRWFESGKGITGETIDLAGYKVAFGTDLLFEHEGVKTGIEICEDLWVPEPPSGKLAMGGAEVIANLSASDELIGKQDYIVSLIRQQSARCRCVYAYASAGWGESSTDLVFSGKTIIGENGIADGQNLRFETGEMTLTKDVDIEKLRNERRKYNTFFDDAEYTLRIIERNKGERKNEKITPDIRPDAYPFVPGDRERLKERCEEIINIQAYGLIRRLEAIGCKRAVVGISGGLDSTLALLVTVKAFDKRGISRKGITGVTMPGLATTSRTKNNATALMEELGVTVKEIAIGEAVAQHFKDIGHDPKKYDATYENSQARERTQILMDLANKENGIVIGTGDMSELALGWCTYNGDHMSMYGVNAGIPKTLVKHLVKWFASQADEKTAAILNDIIATPISPELVPSGNDDISQKTEDLVGPYELHDFFMYHMLRNGFRPKKIYQLAKIAFAGKYEASTIKKWLREFYRRFFSQQFKRSCMPDGPKVGSVSLSPRGDWRMPSDATARIWTEEAENLG